MRLRRRCLRRLQLTPCDLHVPQALRLCGDELGAARLDLRRQGFDLALETTLCGPAHVLEGLDLLQLGLHVCIERLVLGAKVRGHLLGAFGTRQQLAKAKVAVRHHRRLDALRVPDGFFRRRP